MLKMFENKNLVILAVISVCCLLITIVSSQKFQRERKTLNEERYSRMVAEEKLEQVSAKIRSLEANLAKSQAETNQLNALLQGNEGAIAEIKLELEKTTRLNQVLQEQLKNALVQKK
jgi:septal ring factor EnvC (AmiA/AmiB activator)